MIRHFQFIPFDYFVYLLTAHTLSLRKHLTALYRSEDQLNVAEL